MAFFLALSVYLDSFCAIYVSQHALQSMFRSMLCNLCFPACCAIYVSQHALQSMFPSMLCNLCFSACSGIYVSQHAVQSMFPSKPCQLQSIDIQCRWIFSQHYVWHTVDIDISNMPEISIIQVKYLQSIFGATSRSFKYHSLKLNLVVERNKKTLGNIKPV